MTNGLVVAWRNSIYSWPVGSTYSIRAAKTPAMFLSLLALFLGALIVWRNITRYRARGGCHLPPGPPSYPIIGHTPIIPLTDTHLFFHELSKKYGACVPFLLTKSLSFNIVTVRQGYVFAIPGEDYDYSQ